MQQCIEALKQLNQTKEGTIRITTEVLEHALQTAIAEVYFNTFRIEGLTVADAIKLFTYSDLLSNVQRYPEPLI